jgi:hypothetical protein
VASSVLRNAAVGMEPMGSVDCYNWLAREFVRTAGGVGHAWI